MSDYIEAVKIIKNKNGRYDIVNYRSTIKVDGVPSYKVGYNFPLEMAEKEVARIKRNLERVYGTTKINSLLIR